jgi:hypothetical protein
MVFIYNAEIFVRHHFGPDTLVLRGRCEASSLAPSLFSVSLIALKRGGTRRIFASTIGPILLWRFSTLLMPRIINSA